MAKHYVTFGFDHTHFINGHTLHARVVARFDAATPSEGREKAFELFGSKFSFEYHEEEWNEDSMKHFPGGYFDVEYNSELARKAQKEYCETHGIPHFAPYSGKCYQCNQDIYSPIQQPSGRVSGIKLQHPMGHVTGCPHCSCSYCD